MVGLLKGWSGASAARASEKNPVPVAARQPGQGVTHGSVAVMVRYLGGLGLQAQAFETEYGDGLPDGGDAA